VKLGGVGLARTEVMKERRRKEVKMNDLDQLQPNYRNTVIYAYDNTWFEKPKLVQYNKMVQE